MMRRTKRSKFASLRKVPKGREADYAIPLAPGVAWSTNRAGQLHYQQDTQPNTSSDGTRMWAFVLHPGLRNDEGTVPVLPWMVGLEEHSESARYRVLGMQGSVYWTPLASVDEEVEPYSCTGFIMGAWYKLTRHGLGLENDQTTLVTPTLRRQFPFRSLTASDSQLLARKEAGYGVPQVDTAIQPGAEDQVIAQDWRLAEHAKPIGAFCRPWRADYNPSQFTFDDAGQTVAVVNLARLGPGYAVRLPMPRKLVANIGRNEALALYLQIEDNSSGSISSPVGRLTYPDFRVKLLELD